MLLAVLTNVECGRMESKQFNLANHSLNIRVGYIVSVMMSKTTVNDLQIINQFFNIGITL
ncbi:hypothetical protein D3C73_1059220 [compost metagenome]